MPPAARRPWTEALDNLGENLIRLGSSIRSVEKTPGILSNDANFATSLGQLASVFGAAFRQAQPALEAGEDSYLRLLPAEVDTRLPAHPGEEDPRWATTLFHESILGSREIIQLLARITQGLNAGPEIPRKILRLSLHSWSESVLTVGWEIRDVCHEYLAEVELAGGPPTSLEDLGPGYLGLLRDLTSAARQMRAMRRQWYRLDSRLAAAAGLKTGSGVASESFEEP
jgi:hypothetical protein